MRQSSGSLFEGDWDWRRSSRFALGKIVGFGDRRASRIEGGWSILAAGPLFALRASAEYVDGRRRERSSEPGCARRGFAEAYVDCPGLGHSTSHAFEISIDLASECDHRSESCLRDLHLRVDGAA